MNKKVLCWFSCGITSAVACKLAIEKYGVENVVIYYIEIKSANKDNERFIRDCEKWYGCEIKRTRSEKYEDQFEVIEERRFINGAGGALCTHELKKVPRKKVQRTFKNPPIQIFGFEYKKTEINRALRFLEQYPETLPQFPLIENALTKDNCAKIILDAGIDLPLMYILGYNNNNCEGCVKGGKGYWNKIRVDFPHRFDAMAKAERNVGYTCITVKRGGG